MPAPSRPRLRWAHPSEIVAAAREQVDHVLRATRVDVTIEADTPVRVDPRLTAAALAHVLENAAQYAPAGSTIESRRRSTSEGLTIGVRDRGPGIAPADLPHLFERFYRARTAKRARPARGWGCGLPAGCSPPSAAGSGRRIAPTAAPRSRWSCPRRSRRCWRMTAPSRILLVDDEVAIQRAVGPLLRSRGYDVEMSSARAGSAEAAADRAPDLIVLDLGLPDLEGTEVCRRIRATSKVPIIVLSARGARGRQGERARPRRRRLRDQAVRPRRAAGAHPRRAAPGRRRTPTPRHGHFAPAT